MTTTKPLNFTGTICVYLAAYVDLACAAPNQPIGTVLVMASCALAAIGFLLLTQ